MAIERDNPYAAFNFLVDLGTGDTESIKAGFQEVTGLNNEITLVDYRNGNERANHVRKVSTLYKVGDITLKRGMMGATDLWEWVTTARNGSQQGRNITIQLRDETRENTVMTWKLTNARPMRYTAPAFNAKSASDVAIEELVLSCEDLNIE
ncbi:MAG: phage tail protein [Anaerolineae bacterium]|nr:phage tail protein [Anaerolineae bacterium]